MDERILAISNGVLQFARNNLVVKLRFMDMAIHSLTPIPNEDAETVCTDGRYIYYSPRYILKVYKDCANMPTRQYLHMILHCVFRHFFVNTLVDRQKWDLACDIAIESIALELNLDCIALDDDNIRINEKPCKTHQCRVYLQIFS